MVNWLPKGKEGDVMKVNKVFGLVVALLIIIISTMGFAQRIGIRYSGRVTTTSSTPYGPRGSCKVNCIIEFRGTRYSDRRHLYLYCVALESGCTSTIGRNLTFSAKTCRFHSDGKLSCSRTHRIGPDQSIVVTTRFNGYKH